MATDKLAPVLVAESAYFVRLSLPHADLLRDTPAVLEAAVTRS